MWPRRKRGCEERNWWLEVERMAQGDLLQRVNEKWEGSCQESVAPSSVLFCFVLLGFYNGADNSLCVC